MDKIFNPNSIAVIGVSERPTNMGRNIVANLLDFGYKGQIHAVGQREGVVFGHRIHTSIEELPQGIDLAVILTPAPTVPDLMDACGQQGIRRVVIESGGFGEFSAEGQELGERLRAVARKWGIRFVGPNCISVINMDSGVCLPFVRLQHHTLKKGRVSVVSQSGGITIVYTGLFSSAGLGISKAVSMGNKLDLDETDYLAYLLTDENTDIICLHLESIQDGRRLMELARSSPKPILLHKTNVGQASAHIAQSHTAALANDDRIVSAAARQAGMIRARNFRTTVNYAKGLSLPPMKGNTLVAISRSGGRAVIAADMAAAFGFDLYPFPRDFREKVKGFFRAKVIEPTNPLDLGDLFDFRIYVNILEECLKIEAVDAVLMAHSYSSLLERKGTHRLAHAVRDLAAKYNKPVALCPFSEGEEVLSLKKDLEYPTFSEIDEALEALAASRDRYRRSRKRGEAEGAEEPMARPGSAIQADKAPLSISPVRPRDELQRILTPSRGETCPEPGRRDGALMIHQALEVCRGYGIPVAEWATASSPEEAVEAAERLGYPLALKVLSPHISHKSDVGGIALGIEDEDDLKRAWEEMLNRVQEGAPDTSLPTLYPAHGGSAIGHHGFLLQRMVPGGREVILGGKRDPSFGPVVMFGLGGVYVEVFDDVAFRVAPLTREDAEEMIAEVKGSRLLRGIRGEKPSDVEAVVDCLLRLSRLLQDFPAIAEVDINPLIVLEKGALAVDARIILKG
ncbi:MAG: acetate--CoA ligase family protein [Anaerolineae bacterium]